MDYKITFNEDEKLIMVKTQCILNFGIVKAYCLEIETYMQNKQGWNVLIDQSDSSVNSLHFPDINAIASFYEQHIGYLDIEKFAVIINPDEYGIARMWQIIVADKMRAKVQIFKNANSVNHFLNLSD